MLNEGRALVKDVVGQVDGAINNVQAIKKDVTGVWGRILGLFGKAKQPVPSQAPKAQSASVAKPVKKVKQKAPEFDENAIFAEVGQNLTEFFNAVNKLDLWIKEEEEKSRHVFTPDVDASKNAINRVLAQLQMEKMQLELRELMVYHVPPEMKDLYGRINKMLGQIAEEQELARMDELQKEREAAWRKRQMADQIKDRAMYAILTLVMVVWTWATIMVMTRGT
jgi:predicted methyltransferase